MRFFLFIILQCICIICFGQIASDSSRTSIPDMPNDSTHEKRLTTLILNDFYCYPAPKDLVVFYNIDGVILNDRKKAASRDYCKLDPKDIYGKDLYYLVKRRKLRYVSKKIYSKESKEEIRYLSACDSKNYGWRSNDSVIPIVCFTIKTKLPLVLNDTVYYRYKNKKEAVRKYNYNNLTVDILDPDKAQERYGRRARNGIIVVNTKR